MSKIKDKLKEDLYLFAKSHYYTTLAENGNDNQLCEDFENDTVEHVEELIQGDLTSLVNLIESMGYFKLLEVCKELMPLGDMHEKDDWLETFIKLEKAVKLAEGKIK